MSVFSSASSRLLCVGSTFNCGIYLASQIRHVSTLRTKNNPFKGKRSVLLSKTSRYDYERNLQPQLNEIELKEYLTSKGSDYDGLLEKHKLNQKCVQQIEAALRNRGFDLRTVDRNGYSEEVVANADVIFTAGGDGTFLLAASRVLDRTTPVIGFNTDPERSEGRLCLPHRYSHDPDAALEKFIVREFTWLWRQRIRVVSSGKYLHDRPRELHEQFLRYPEHRYHEYVGEHEQLCRPARIHPNQPPRVLPVRALNEVFVGESLSARVSYYEISIDGCAPMKQKSSGVSICSGTGSTSWHFHINHLPHEAVAQVLNAARSVAPTFNGVEEATKEEVRAIGDVYNSQLFFSPEEERMAFTIRDPLSNRVFHVDKRRGFARHIKIRSRMWDGNLVLDGGSVFHFNDGAVATFEILPEDSLMCVQMSEN